MRKIDYNLNIIHEKKKYKPRIEFIKPIINSDKKIFTITAANGYGKTFVLNLIAFALGADKLGDEYILKSLRESVSRYNDSDYYDLNYDLNFELPDNKKLILRKDSNKDKIVQFDGEPPMSLASLHNNISILYDVPTDPSKRLNAVIKDIGIWNKQLESKINGYWSYLRNLQNDFSNVKDENKISSYKESIEEYKNKIEKKENHIKDKNKELKQLTNIDDLIKLSVLVKRNDIINSDKFKKENKFKSLKKPIRTSKKDDTLIKNLQSQYSESNNVFRRTVLSFIEFISNDPQLLDFISDDKKLDQSFIYIRENTIEDLIDGANEIVRIKRFANHTDDLKNEIIGFIQREKEGKKYVIHTFLKDLLSQINELIEHDAEDILEEITNSKSKILIEEISTKIQNYKIKDYSEILKFLQTNLKNIERQIVISYKLRTKINIENKKKGVDASEDEYYRCKAQIDELKLKLKTNNKELTSLKHSCSISSKIAIENLDTLERINHAISGLKYGMNNVDLFRDLKDTIKEKSKEIDENEKQLSKLNYDIKFYQAKLDIESKKNVSKFSDENKNKIDQSIKNFQIIIQNLGKFKGVINSIDNETFNNFNDDEDKDFIKVAGSIIAHSMDNKILRPDGEYAEFSYYDMIKKEFHCQGDIKIRKDDISTGLASANYLKQRIDNVEGDYVIILLDEIGNMNQGTLNEVIKSIKKLEMENRLVLALLTKPKDDGILIEEY